MKKAPALSRMNETGLAQSLPGPTPLFGSWYQPAVSRGVVVLLLGNVACGQDDSANVGAGTAIRGAGSQSLAPQSLVSQAVCAHNADARKFVAQPLDVV